jgi:MAC/Perforin domain
MNTIPVEEDSLDDVVPVPLGVWEWSQHSTKRETPPSPQPIIRLANGEALEPHGTFTTYPYYAVIEKRTPGKPGEGEERQLFLVSDAGLRAELKFIPSSRRKVKGRDNYGGQFRIIVKGKEDDPKFQQATLSYDLLEPDGRDEHVIVVTGTPTDFDLLPSGSREADKHYVPNEPLRANAYGNDTAYKNIFVHKISAMGFLRRAWDVRGMDLVDCNFQITGNGMYLFADVPEGSKDYSQGGDNYLVPYGWAYGMAVRGREHEKMHTVEDSAEIANSVLQASGFHVSGSLGSSVPAIVETKAEFSVARNDELTSKIGEAKSQRKTTLEKDVIHTEAALVIDKRNAVLSKAFRDKVNQLRPLVNSNGLTPEVLGGFFDKYGTHYAFAMITGAKGRLVTTITHETITNILNSGKKGKSQWEVGGSVSILGGLVSGSAKGGSDHQDEIVVDKKNESILEQQDTYVITYGGSASAGGEPGTDHRVPVLLDLRPIADLFTVPFYTDYTTAILLHDQIAAAAKDYLFTPQSQIPRAPGLGYRKITFDPLQIEVTTPRSHPELGIMVDQGPLSPLQLTDYGAFLKRWAEGTRITEFYASTEGKVLPLRLKGNYHDPSQLADPSNWRVRLVFPADTCMGRAGSLAWPRLPLRPDWWQMKEVDKHVASGRAGTRSQTVEVSSLGGSSVLLSPNMQDANFLRVGFDVFFDSSVKLNDWEVLVPGVFSAPPAQRAYGFFDMRGPDNGGPDTFGFAPFRLPLVNLTVTGIGDSPLQFPVVVTVSGRIEQATVNELLNFNL